MREGRGEARRKKKLRELGVTPNEAILYRIGVWSLARRIFIAVEDVYAERVLPRLLAGRCGVPIIVKRLQSCSCKMSRIVHNFVGWLRGG